jgi:hypothetical protein
MTFKKDSMGAASERAWNDNGRIQWVFMDHCGWWGVCCEYMLLGSHDNGIIMKYDMGFYYLGYG